MNVVPGWYPDNMGVVRYWDGAQWTEHTQAPQVPQTEHAQPLAPQTGAAELQVVPQYTQPQYAQPQYAQPQYGQPQYAPQQYQQRIVSTGESNGMAVAGFIVGLVSIFLPFIFGLAAGGAGLVLSILGAVKSGTTGTGKGLAIAGIVLSSVGIIFIL